MSIRRYEHSSGTLRLHREGTLVSFADHEAELSALRDKRDALRAAIEQAPHKLTCGWWSNKLDDIAGASGKTLNCTCWKRAALGEQ